MPAGSTTVAGLAARRSHVMAASTARFLDRIGVREGWSCLDVGFGDGEVTLELARRAGRSGRVVGLDADAEELAAARRLAAAKDVEATFVEGDATALPERGSFDLAYARLVLSDLADQETR